MVGVLITFYVMLVMLTGTKVDIIWALPKLTLLIGSSAVLLSILDLISNAYQEVSADLRHAEVIKVLTDAITERDYALLQLSTQVKDLSDKIDNQSNRITIL